MFDVLGSLIENKNCICMMMYSTNIAVYQNIIKLSFNVLQRKEDFLSFML